MSMIEEKKEIRISAEEEERTARQIAEKYNLEFIKLDNFELDPELFRTMPADLMLKYSFIPVKFKDGVLRIAIADASNVLIQDELELLLGSTIEIVISTLSAIQGILKKSESSQRVLEEATETFRFQVVKEEDNGEEVISIDKITSDASPMIKLVDSIIFNAIQRRASDIHIETRDKDVSVKYRIDGVLQYAMDPLDKRYHNAIISRIKVMSELDIAEKRIPQDGRFKLKIKGRAIDFRVSIMPSIHGEDSVIRILDKETLSESFAELKLQVLGFNPAIIKKVKKYIAAPYGMVLVTGPTGSGKTTTLYASLNEIKSVEHKLITIEDPVEYQLEGITQVPVNEKKGLTFARGLRSILRHDPDKIMVGEIRDPETALIAIQSALTGHLVFTTVHANNVLDVLGRFLNMGVAPYNFVNSLLCVLAQRLVRVICENCKKRIKYPDDYLEESGLDPKKYRDMPFYDGGGCMECSGTGFRGRTAIAELLEINDKIRDALLTYKNSADIRRIARDEGMTFLREAALEKVFDATTTLKEANKVTFVDENL
jgi:type IV pilus assembly protein PilB